MFDFPCKVAFKPKTFSLFLYCSANLLAGVFINYLDSIYPHTHTHTHIYIYIYIYIYI